MKIVLISTHSFPITISGTITHTGDIVIVDLARSLEELGHEIVFIAPEGSYVPTIGRLLPMRASFGQFPPSSQYCEEEAFHNYSEILKTCDIVHDFSVSKRIITQLYQQGYHKVIQTIMGGAWTYDYPPHNLIVWSESHRNRVLRGATDYENTPTPDLAGPPQKPVSDAHVVFGGIDTNFYYPTYEKKNYFLWMNRWHFVKGYREAIELAKRTGIELVMAGEHPDNEMFEYQRNCALEAVELAKGHSNIRFEWLPKDPDHHIAKRKLYQEAKCLLYSVQFHEPFGLSQVESLACGTPVIGTNYGSVPELIKDHVGLVCDNNLNSFAEAIFKLNVDSKVCREYAVKNFDRKVMAENYLKEYYKVLNGSSHW